MFFCRSRRAFRFHETAQRSRSRVVSHVEEGHTHRATAIHFRVSIKFVNDMVKRKQETGHLAPTLQTGRPGRGKLDPYKGWIMAQVQAHSDVTLAELARDLRVEFDINADRSSLCRLLHRMKLSHKKRHFMPKNKGATNGAANIGLT